MGYWVPALIPMIQTLPFSSIYAMYFSSGDQFSCPIRSAKEEGITAGWLIVTDHKSHDRWIGTPTEVDKPVKIPKSILCMQSNPHEVNTCKRPSFTHPRMAFWLE